jgi:hypothetical protein
MQFQTIKARGKEFVLAGSMLIEKAIFDDVRTFAPRGHTVSTWENAQFKRKDYLRIREEGYYTESVYNYHAHQRTGKKSHALFVLADGSGVRRAAAFEALSQQ